MWYRRPEYDPRFDPRYDPRFIQDEEFEEPRRRRVKYDADDPMQNPQLMKKVRKARRIFASMEDDLATWKKKDSTNKDGDKKDDPSKKKTTTWDKVSGPQWFFFLTFASPFLVAGYIMSVKLALSLVGIK